MEEIMELELTEHRYSIINYPLNTIFDQLDIFLGSTLVSQASKNYHYLSFIEAITQVASSSIETYLASAGFITSFNKANYDFDGIKC